MNFLNAVAVITHREILRYGRDKIRIATSFFQPIMFLLIFGGGLRNAMAASDFGVDYVKFIFPGIIALNVMGVAIFSSLSTVWDREFGFLKEILAAPVPRSAIALGKASGAATIATLQAFVLFLLAPVVGVHFGLVPILGLFGFTVLLAFAVSGLGLVIASRMRSMESFGIVMQVLVFPMFYLSGSFFPLTDVPAWMKVASRLDPLTYGVDAFRRIMLRNDLPPAVAEVLFAHSLLINALALLAIAGVLLTAAVRGFEKRY
jgi:ABC-2 type transport system permease protein